MLKGSLNGRLFSRHSLKYISTVLDIFQHNTFMLKFSAKYLKNTQILNLSSNNSTGSPSLKAISSKLK